MSKYVKENILKNRLEVEELKEKIKTVKDEEERKVINNRINFLEKHVPQQIFNNRWTSSKGHFKWRMIVFGITFLVTTLIIFLVAYYV